MRLRSLFASVAVSALVSTALVSTASGAPDDAHIGFAQSFDVEDNTLNGAIGMCEKGERALSGGLVQSGPSHTVELRTSGPVGESGGDFSAADGERPAGWVGSATNYSGQEYSAKVFPVCAQARAIMAVKRFTGKLGESKRVTVDCPGSRRALGGGIVQRDNPGFDYIRESGPTDGGGFDGIRTGDVPTGWRGVLESQEADDVYKLVAICVKGSQATMKVATRKPSSPSFDADHAVRCPDGKRAVGGGLLYRGSPQANVVAGGIGPLDETGSTAETTNGDVPKYWYGAINPVQGELNTRYKVIALCE